MDAETMLEDLTFENLRNRVPTVEVRYLDIHGIISKSTGTSRITVRSSARQLEHVIDSIPQKGDIYRIISGRFGFSICDVVERFCNLGKFDSMKCTTFRIGHREFTRVVNLLDSGKLKSVSFVTSKSQARLDKKYDYVNRMRDDRISIRFADNHSKLVLLNDGENHIVIETSSNFNENPKIEQFNITNDKVAFDFYNEFFETLGV